MVALTYNYSTLEDEPKGSLGVQGQPRLHSKFQVNAVRPSEQTNTNKERKKKSRPRMVVYTYNSSIWKTEAGESGTQIHP